MAEIKKSKIVMSRWEEPQAGQDAEVWSLTPNEWIQVEAAIAWVERYWEKLGGGALGDTIVETAIRDTKAAGADRETVSNCLQTLADNVRYTSGEELYTEECPTFAAYEIERS